MPGIRYRSRPGQRPARPVTWWRRLPQKLHFTGAPYLFSSPADVIAESGVDHRLASGDHPVCLIGAFVADIRPRAGDELSDLLLLLAAEQIAMAHADITVMTVWPILILSRFFSNWTERMRRPLSAVPLVESRSSTYHRPRTVRKRACWPEAKSSSMMRLPSRPTVKSVPKV